LGRSLKAPIPTRAASSTGIEATPNGYRVTDVWKDKAACEKFIAEKVGPVSVQLGVPQPQVKFIDVAKLRDCRTLGRPESASAVSLAALVIPPGSLRSSRQT
jgi:hypothetical protein